MVVCGLAFYGVTIFEIGDKVFYGAKLSDILLVPIQVACVYIAAGVFEQLVHFLSALFTVKGSTIIVLIRTNLKRSIRHLTFCTYPLIVVSPIYIVLVSGVCFAKRAQTSVVCSCFDVVHHIPRP